MPVLRPTADDLTSDEELKKMLEEAYEAGWRGTLDLKESYSEKVIAERNKSWSPKSMPFVSYPTASLSATITGGTYTVSSDSSGSFFGSSE